MCDNHRKQVFCGQVQAQKLSDLVDAIGDRLLLIQDQLIDDLAQNFLCVWLYFVLNANDQIVKLIESLLFQVYLEGVFFHISENRLN